MRIISGTCRGRKLHTPRNSDIRPTSDRAREALFSILHNNIPDALVLDLFAGTGALGIEALSRGARSCTFIDHSNHSLETIYKNVELLSEFEEKNTIIKHDLAKSLPNKLFSSLAPNGYDLIMADPPYSKGLGEKMLQLINQSDIVHKNTVIVIEERSTENLSENTSTLELINKRKYGEAAFWFYKLKQDI